MIRGSLLWWKESVSESPCGAWLSWGTLTCFGHSKSKSQHWSCKDTRILRCIYYSSGLSWVMQIEEALMWTGWITYPRPRGEQTVGPGFEITAIYPTAIYIISTLFWIPSEKEPAQSLGSREEWELPNEQATHIDRWLPCIDVQGTHWEEPAPTSLPPVGGLLTVI